MLIPGLVSITFRELDPHRIVELCRETGLRSIEWGGDVHVPHGNLAAARRVRHLTTDAGLEVSAYGSYYRAGNNPVQGPTFDIIRRTTVELGAPLVRVWAGSIGSAEADALNWKTVTDDLRRCCDSAAADDIGVSLEFHGGTLADTAESAMRLIHDVGRANLTTYWQPPNGMEREQCVRGLNVVLAHVENVHVFHWWPDHEHRLPLEDGADRWRSYFAILSKTAVKRHVSLEFVRDSDVEQLKTDAKVLHSLLADS